jgi:hypothetical protein
MKVFAMVSSIIYLMVASYIHAAKLPLDVKQIVIEDGTGKILSKIKNKAKSQKISQKSMGEIMQWTALRLVGSPYVPALLDKSTPEYLYIGLSKTDCMLFTEEVLVLSRMIKHNKLDINNLTSGIYNVRYHDDFAYRDDFSYCERNHYFKDWALSNQKKSLVIDQGLKLTDDTLPYDAHVLSDRIKNSKNHAQDFSCIREREALINKEKVGFISMAKLPSNLKSIKPGDIIGIVRTPSGKADSVAHLGIAYIHNGKVGMIHASSSSVKKVIIEKSLTNYLAKFKDSQGIILLRAQ